MDSSLAGTSKADTGEPKVGFASAGTGLSQQAMEEWRRFLVKYKAGDFPRDQPPPIPEVIQRLLDSPAALLPTATPSWLNSKWARPESPEEREWFCRDLKGYSDGVERAVLKDLGADLLPSFSPNFFRLSSTIRHSFHFHRVSNPLHISPGLLPDPSLPPFTRFGGRAEAPGHHPTIRTG